MSEPLWCYWRCATWGYRVVSEAFGLQDNDAKSRYSIHLDGAYMCTSVYVNGKLVGTRPYGFISFSYDLTPFLNKQGDNVIAVKVDNSQQPNSRWYTGCGITDMYTCLNRSDVRIAEWGVQAISELKRVLGTSQSTHK